jgi:predicted transcriptional regulator
MNKTNSPLNSSSNLIQEKWGDALLGGYLVAPSVLFIRQYQLGLSNSELITLLNILASWRAIDSLPRLNPTTIAKRMNVDARTAQRNISSLVRKGYIEKKLDITTGTSYYVLDKLVTKLKTIAPQLVANRPVEAQN